MLTRNTAVREQVGTSAREQVDIAELRANNPAAKAARAAELREQARLDIGMSPKH